MRGRLLLLSAAVLIAALVFFLARRPPTVASTPPEAAVEGAAAPAAMEPAPIIEEDAIAEEPAEPAAPAAATEPGPVAIPEPPPEPAVVVAPEPEATLPPSVPLEKLLTLPAKPESPAVGLEVDRNPHLREGAGTEAASAGKGRDIDVRVKNRKEQVGIAGQTSVKHTDASVGVPVGDSVEVRGGVAVERRREAGEGTDVKPSPNVGLEMRF